jgi:hypothetical protein
MRYCDVLRVKAEFPINLWPNGVQAYHRWIHDALRQNLPYDVFARKLLTTSGSNFRVPPVNFYRAIQSEEPLEIARAVALTFLGMRMEDWSPQEIKDFSQLFSRISFKSTAEWKECIVGMKPDPFEPTRVRMLDGAEVVMNPATDPRQTCADWLLQEKNPFFARHGVNRIWFWVMGRGLIEPVDDVRKNSRPVNPELLEYLVREFKTAKYDVKHLLRLMFTSRTYGASTVHTDYSRAEKHFAVYSLRSLDAEIIIDALHDIFGPEGPKERYKSEIPEPFTFIPSWQRAVMLADASITSPFLETFGRPSRDSGFLAERRNQPTKAQRLFLLNSSRIQRMINQSPTIKEILAKYQKRKNPLKFMLEDVYLRILSRFPTPDEVKRLQETMRRQRQAKDVPMADRFKRQDLLWVLINSKEFLFRH